MEAIRRGSESGSDDAMKCGSGHIKISYKIATMLDVGPTETILVEPGMGYGPYGLVGIGEDVATGIISTC
jgi:hypothetical protein